MLKETIILIGLCSLSSTARIHAQQETSPFNTIGETQKKKVRTMVEVLTDTTVQDSLKEDMDMQAGSPPNGCIAPEGHPYKLTFWNEA